MILAIDPGLRACGVAIGGHESGLLRAELVLNTIDTDVRGPQAWTAMALAIDYWVGKLPFWCPKHDLFLYVEVPRIYPHQRYAARGQKVDPNDLLELAGVIGAVSTLFRLEGFYYPSDWKGQVPKKIMNERVLKKLSPEECENIISVGVKDHNTLDAVGIFLHAVGRL